MERPSKGLVRIYLAGPEVFLLNAIETGGRKKVLCRDYGFEGVFPLDAELEVGGLSRAQAGLKTGRLNEQLIRSCQIVVANMTPFRGPSADVGTALEMGFAGGLGLKVFAYTNDSRRFTARTVEWLGKEATRDAEKRLCDENGMRVEDWELADNLMLESCILNSGGALVTHDAAPSERFSDLRGFEACLKRVSAAHPK